MAKYDIFISYSRKDRKKVDLILHTLQSEGYSVWIDIDGIESGEAFRSIIVSAIENSDIILFFSSSSSNSSSWTTKEISLAVDEKKYIIPIKLDSTKYNNSIRFDLIDLDYIDMSNELLYPAAINRLIKTIKNKIGERKPKSGPEPEPDIDPMPGEGSFFLRLKNELFNSWISRNNFINIILCIYALFAISGFFIPHVNHAFIPASIMGIVGIFYLMINSRNGIAFITAASLLLLLGEAYITAPDIKVFRFFKESNLLSIILPFFITLLTISLFLFKKKEISYWQLSKKMDPIGIIILTVAVVFWIWIIYFDIKTKYGLPPNLRHYIGTMIN